MARYRHEPEIVLEAENFNDASTRSVTFEFDTGEDVEASATVPGGKIHWLIGVSFGLLCILQATLNISLRAALFSHHDSLTRDIEMNETNFETEAKSIILTADKHKTTLSDFDLQYRAVIEELDNMGTMLRHLVTYNGWKIFGNSTYFVSCTTKTWQESRDYCRQRGADLIIINSEEEQNFAKQFKKRVWIGLTDSVDEGTWKWVDGTQLKTSYWIDKEPNGNRTENCGELKSFEKEKSWNDEPCSQWICEKKLI